MIRHEYKLYISIQIMGKPALNVIYFERYAYDSQIVLSLFCICTDKPQRILKLNATKIILNYVFHWQYNITFKIYSSCIITTKMWTKPFVVQIHYSQFELLRKWSLLLTNAIHIIVYVVMRVFNENNLGISFANIR